MPKQTRHLGQPGASRCVWHPRMRANLAPSVLPFAPPQFSFLMFALGGPEDYKGKSM